MPNPPVQISPVTIDAELQYIIDNWFQNNSQLVTGQIGLNVTWNLATFIKQNPDNYDRASVIAAANVNYTTLAKECYLIFINNSAGSLDYTTNPNIWNKYFIVNQSSNPRTLVGNGYINISGTLVTSVAPQTAVFIAKGNDGNWYEVLSVGTSSSGAKPPLIGVVDGGNPDDPVSGTSIYQNNKLIGLAASNNQRCQIVLSDGILSNFGENIQFILDNVTGEIDIDPNEFQPGQSLYIDLNQ